MRKHNNWLRFLFCEYDANELYVCHKKAFKGPFFVLIFLHFYKEGCLTQNEPFAANRKTVGSQWLDGSFAKEIWVILLFLNFLSSVESFIY